MGACSPQLQMTAQLLSPNEDCVVRTQRQLLWCMARKMNACLWPLGSLEKPKALLELGIYIVFGGEYLVRRDICKARG